MNNPRIRRGGFALVIVLGLVVLIVSVLVAFLLSTATERSASSGFAASVSARQYGDTAVALVEAQINHATTSSATVGSPVAWTTQPGLLRTFSQNGNLLNMYKLYSADNMITSSPQDDVDLPPADWAKNPALWVDLNARVATGVDPTSTSNPKAETYAFPILDPRSLADIGTGSTKMSGLNNNGLALDPAASALSGATFQPSGIPTTPDGIPTAPMPVHWLYILQDGTVVAPTGAGTNQVSISGETATNPVTGRVAFWTDDDTSKVNINTASEGTFWDSPHGYNAEETYKLASFQPARGEYQRYPGHPATVSLSSVFPSLLPEDIYMISPRVTGDSEFGAYTGWTSKGGTQKPKSVTSPTNTSEGVHSDGERLYTSVDELIFRAKRQPAAPTATPSGRDLTSTITTDTSSLSALTPAVVKSRGFFLTAHSRAPETNLFNLPRIATWPVFKLASTNPVDPNVPGVLDSQRTTAFDRVIALCSSTGPAAYTNGPTGTVLTLQQPYFFQRELARDPINDLGDPYGSPPTVGKIPRNLQLYSYLQDLTNQAIPGFGGGTTFKGKYPTDRDQILTEMFDYVRSLNLYDDLLDFTPSGSKVTPPGQYTFTTAVGNSSGTSSHGLVTPIVGPNATMGQGRYYTLQSLNLCFGCCAEYLTNDSLAVSKTKYNTVAGDPQQNYMLYTPPWSGGTYKALLPGQSRIQAMVLPNLYSTMVGWRLCNPDIRIQIEGLDQLAVKTVNENGIAFYQSLGLPKIAQLQSNPGVDPIAFGGGSGTGGPLIDAYMTFKEHLHRPTSTFPSVVGGGSYLTPLTDIDGYPMYPFVGYPFTVSNVGRTTSSPVNPGSMILSSKTGTAVTVTVTIWEAGDATRYTALGVEGATSSLPTQTIQISIPVMTIPVPQPDTYSTYGPNPSDLSKAHYPVGNSFYTDGSGLSRLAGWDATTGTQKSGSDGRLNVGAPGSIGTVLAYNPYTFGNSADVIRGFIPAASNPTATLPAGTTDWKGDYRLVAGTHDVPKGVFQPHPLSASPKTFVAATLCEPGAALVTGASTIDPNYFKYNYSDPYTGGSVTLNVPAPATATGDFDRPIATRTGGASCNKPDEGDAKFTAGTNAPLINVSGTSVPYYQDWNSQTPEGQTYSSPNRIMPSPVMFGSLPTGIKSINTKSTIPGLPWQTLLFRPLASTETGHVGANSPKDHLLLDLFWMPVVDPYAISDRFSTAGKINLNYKIIPFTYIKRTTAMRAALKGEKVTRIPNTDANLNISNYSGGPENGVYPPNTSYRIAIDPTETMKEFDSQKFTNTTLKSAGKNVFISPSEICEMYMVPSGMSYTTQSALANDAAQYLQSGDNMRERVYATLYQKLTTKSNTFTVHFRAQALKRAPSSTAGTWTEGKDAVLGEYRGSTTIERFIDPSATLPDYATDAGSRTSKSLDYFYKWRTVENTQFAP